MLFLVFFFHFPTPEGAREDHSRGEVEGQAERRDTLRMRLTLLFFLQQGQNNLPKLLHYDLCEAVSWVQREGRDQCFHLRFSVFTHTRWKGLQRIISWSNSNFNVDLVLLAFSQPNMIKKRHSNLMISVFLVCGQVLSNGFFLRGFCL